MVGGKKEADKTECLARRLLPLTVEPGLTMMMVLDDSCMACGANCLTCGEPCLVLCEDCCKASVEANAEDKRQCPDSSSFLRSLKSLPKDERHTYLRASRSEVKATLSQLVSCVGCRRSVENLHQALQKSEGAALHPLAISQDGDVFVPKNHLETPDSLARLFVPNVIQLSSSLLGLQEGGRSGRGKGKGITRCPQHTVGSSKSPLATTWTWRETWESMESECREAATILPKSVLCETLQRYLKKHQISPDSSLMVNRSFSQLMDNDQGAGEDIGERPNNVDQKRNLYSIISTCVKEGHVHVKCDYVGQLITLAEPHFSETVKQMRRHTKNITDAQKEVLICIGIALFERFERIQQKIDEGKRSCDLLLLVCLKSLRHKLDVAAERMKGDDYMDQLCFELERGNVNEKGDKKEKKQKKTKKKERKKKEQSVEIESKETDGGDARVSLERLHSFTRSDEEGEVNNKNKDNVIRKKEKEIMCHGTKKDFLPANLDNHVTLVSAVSSARCPISYSGLSLTEMLEDEEQTVEEIEPIPADVIKSFQRSKEKTTEMRKELREDLRQRFANYCQCHNTLYCPEWCFQKKSEKPQGRLIAGKYF